MTWAGESSQSGVYIFTEDGSPDVVFGNQGDLIRWGQNNTPEFVDPASITGVNAHPHNLLSSTHGDTEPGSATDGDLVFASGTEWARLPISSPTGLVLTIGEDSRPQWFTATPGPQGPAGASSGITVHDEGVDLGTFDVLDFVGAAVTATDGGASVVTITIPGGGGGLPPSFIVEAAGTITTTSTSDVLATSMTLTPASGIYTVWFAASLANDGANDTTFMSIWSAGAQVAASEQQRKLNRADDIVPGIAIAKVTVNGSQAIEGRWRVDAGTGTMHDRTLLLIEVVEG